MENRELIEKAQEHSGAKSMTELAKKIGMNQSSLSLLASGKGELSDETYIKLAKLAGVDPAEVLIEKHERKAGPEARAVWARINAAVLSKSAVLGLGAILLLPAPKSHADNPNFSFPTINIMRTKISNIHQPYTSSIQIDKSLLSKLTSKLDCR
ncbi:helix-turn-helix domain-containing protein [Acidithiobacillus albertensis]|uniref:helix-turn-helix domain-containing protein n=1 Tax=Acidithiobacillus albertensis TaxID=119978 RepID=UPI00094B6EC9|nr:helix-turn-helix domain-containing protein [Acidithiobacillus albertensis]